MVVLIGMRSIRNRAVLWEDDGACVVPGGGRCVGPSTFSDNLSEGFD